ncbi:MAG: NAD(+) synthase, partial [Spirochaetaceae bacterium]
MNALPFDSLYRHGFVRVSVAVPVVRVSDVAHNLDATVVLAREADRAGSLVVVFPELGLTGYSNDDLFQQEALLSAAEDALAVLVTESVGLRPLIIVGLPARYRSYLYNVAVAVHRGRILGAVPKSYVPTYREFYERRQFTPGASVRGASITLCGASVPFGVDLLYQATDVPDLIVHTEICEDLWVPAPPSTAAALSGATVLANLSASNATIGKSDYRRSLGSGQSARCIAAHLYSAAGSGESTTDLAWDGDATIHENGRLLCESRRFSVEPQLISADVHLALLAQDRMRMTTFADNAERAHAEFRRIEYG